MNADGGSMRTHPEALQVVWTCGASAMSLDDRSDNRAFIDAEGVKNHVHV